ncbi:MAG: murein biosynthesis integral membrane protein MurJ [Actinobacteria bacterium]|nr:MAG: murein biosynthesis integral membrane protein MurJ [Actinomycetota bacterium]
MANNREALAKNTLTLTILTTISRATGFLRLAVLAAVLGGAALADNFNLANETPNMIYELIMGGILSSVIIPIFIEYLNQRSEEEAWEVASIITNLAMLILITTSILGCVFSFYIIRAQALTVPSSKIAIAVFLFRIFSFQIVFYGLAAICTAILNSYRRFAVPAFAPIINNIVVIITALIFSQVYKYNPAAALYILAIGTTLGVISLFVMQIPSIIKVWVGYKLSFNFRHPAIKRLLILSVPLFIYVGTNVFQMFFESNLVIPVRGGKTAFTWAWPFFQLPFGIFAVSIITALFPDISEHASTNNNKELQRDVSLGIRITALIMVPSAILLTFLSYPICELVLKWYRFSEASTVLTAGALSYFAVGLFSFAIFMYLLKVFYALQDTVTPTIVNLISTAITLAFDLIIVRYLEVSGIALGRSIGFSISAIVLFLLLKKRIGAIQTRAILVSLTKFLVAGSFMGLVAYFSLQSVLVYFPPSTIINKIIDLFLPAILSVSIYILAIYILKTKEIKVVTRAVRTRF